MAGVSLMLPMMQWYASSFRSEGHPKVTTTFATAKFGRIQLVEGISVIRLVVPQLGDPIMLASSRTVSWRCCCIFNVDRQIYQDVDVVGSDILRVVKLKIFQQSRTSLASLQRSADEVGHDGNLVPVDQLPGSAEWLKLMNCRPWPCLPED